VPRLILILALGISAWLVYRRLRSLPPAQRRSETIRIAAVVLLAVVVLLTLTGRMHWIGAAVTGLVVAAGRLLPWAMRLFPVLQWFNRQRGPGAGAGTGESTVATGLLRMVLDHATGAMRGEVLGGAFSGRELDDMDRDELEQLLAECRSTDPDSARLLESYLQRRFGADAGYQQTPPPASGGNMSRAEALAVLGLDGEPAEKDIVDAHRRLMQKLHPDRGGNDYLAAKLNQAKDTLLG
jgi:hypothetical protein